MDGIGRSIQKDVWIEDYEKDEVLKEIEFKLDGQDEELIWNTEDIRKSILKSQEKNKVYFDTRHGTKEVHVKAGQWVGAGQAKRRAEGHTKALASLEAYLASLGPRFGTFCPALRSGRCRPHRAADHQEKGRARGQRCSAFIRQLRNHGPANELKHILNRARYSISC
ncbi:hypothetical protein NDU88_003897 [Pleurodeles waltl]|uniref:Uncharacterized protein n=1 Tax=Pleurodeles waltl TaxID=8319 RepID=A0AAV7LMV7_PLEWA|nr:hypothetical protein NDU88_003897 [Pleurodeles waltl]